MSIPTSKSKTQLAYARSTKAVNKPKNKINNQTQQTDLTKTKQPARNSTGNIYESIMGQIDTTQQDYIKSLIVKNQKETLKSQKESQKQLTKGLKQLHQQKKTTVSIIKSGKSATISQKGSTTNLHEKTKSLTNLLQQQSQVKIENEKFIKVETENLNNQIRFDSQQVQNCVTTSQVKAFIPQKDESKLQKFLTTFPQTEKQQKTSGSTNPIIEALNNTSAQFEKKLQAFQLQYPTEERQERSTHKKIGSKIAGGSFSYQSSPKNGGKHVYTQQIIVTTKPEQIYYSSANKKERHQTTKISPISVGKNSKSKLNAKRLNENDQNIPTSFLSCLDEYLEALSLNPNESQENNRPSNGSYNMKRSNSNKMREFSKAKGFTNHFVFDKYDEEDETIVLQSASYHNALQNKMGQLKQLSLPQQQKLFKALQEEKKKVSQLKAIIDLLNKQLTKYKKKQKKLKQNQFHMVQLLKSQDYQLTQQKKQRRKLQQVVKQFESKIRGISKEKEKKRRGSMEEEQRPQRKTIYGTSSIINSIQYGQPLGNFYYKHQMMQKDTPHKIQRASIKDSKKRFSSVINSMTQDYSRNVLNTDQYDYYYPQKRIPVQDNGFSKNRTQKISKIISSFDLQNQPINDQDQLIYRSSQMRNSNKKINPLNSCKNSYMNSSLPGQRQPKSRPMTPKLIEQLFKGNKKLRNDQSQHQKLQYFNQRIQNQNFESESEQQLSPEYVRQQQYNDFERNINQSDGQQDSSFNPTVNSDDSEEYEERNSRDYHLVQQNDMVKRMR